eukprot:CAMPEP_0181029280 /NCGR_PEP_ID=MMETSP1070-20121207/5110_1 /TAXON_ID=265543 /ORGANISM="Minutocellus polymorphus, Strain NH13" /LENGTH=49 /DNA_ID=CAMNT_0023106571 /DNA_START=317 /DNA_END=469 /DNA_ORIENTATION=-
MNDGSYQDPNMLMLFRRLNCAALDTLEYSQERIAKKKAPTTSCSMALSK